MNNVNKYLGPYIPYKTDSIKNGFIRKYVATLGGFIVWRQGSGSIWCSVLFTKKTFPSKEAAMNALDIVLLKEGYVFLTEEQIDKLKVLI